MLGRQQVSRMTECKDILAENPEINRDELAGILAKNGCHYTKPMHRNDEPKIELWIYRLIDMIQGK